MLKNKVYTFYGAFLGPIMPGADYQLNWNLNSQFAPFLLKSIIFNTTVFDFVTQEIIPDEQNHTFAHGLNIGVNPLRTIGYMFQDFVSIPAGFVPITGNGLMLLKTGQYFFDSFEVENFMDFEILYQNFDLIRSIGFEINVTAEIQLK